MKKLSERQLRYLEKIVTVLETNYDIHNDSITIPNNGRFRVYPVLDVLKEYINNKEYMEYNARWLNELHFLYYEHKKIKQ